LFDSSSVQNRLKLDEAIMAEAVMVVIASAEKVLAPPISLLFLIHLLISRFQFTGERLVVRQVSCVLARAQFENAASAAAQRRAGIIVSLGSL
jgi:hypothetical protein